MNWKIDAATAKTTLALAWPVMLTQLGQVSVQLFDNIIVGNLLGSEALASVSLGNALFFSVFIFGLGISMAIPPLVSAASSRRDTAEIQSVFEHGLVLNFAVGILLMLIVLGMIPLLVHAHQPPQIIPATQDFLWVMAISIIPFMFFQTLRELSEGLGFTAGVAAATVAANVINIVLNYVFIKGLFGLPPMGVRGSALATLIARICMLAIIIIIMLRHDTTRQYIKNFRLRIGEMSSALFRKMLQLGVPTALQMFFEVTAFAAAAFICGLVSAEDVAAHQIALSMASFTFNLCIGFSVASTVLVGRHFGARDFLKLRQVGVTNLKMVFIYMFLCCLLFVIFRHVLPTYFTRAEDVAVIHLASKLLIIAALFQLSDGIQVCSLGILRGMQDVKIPGIITFIAYWIITIPLGYVLCVVYGMGAFGMWIALGIGLSISAVLLIYRFHRLSARFIKGE